MANANKAKGTRWESDVVRYLRENGFRQARRAAQEGRKDVGDIHVRDFALQAKAYTNVAEGVRAGVERVAEQRDNAGLAYAAAVIKRPRKNVREGLVVMTLHEFVRLLKAFYAALDRRA